MPDIGELAFEDRLSLLLEREKIERAQCRPEIACSSSRLGDSSGLGPRHAEVLASPDTTITSMPTGSTNSHQTGPPRLLLRVSYELVMNRTNDYLQL